MMTTDIGHYYFNELEKSTRIPRSIAWTANSAATATSASQAGLVLCGYDSSHITISIADVAFACAMTRRMANQWLDIRPGTRRIT